VVTASPFSQTAAILEVVAPLSVPMKILLLMLKPVKLKAAAAKASDFLNFASYRIGGNPSAGQSHSRKIFQARSRVNTGATTSAGR
jgi:hypothetical protein